MEYIEFVELFVNTLKESTKEYGVKSVVLNEYPELEDSMKREVISFEFTDNSLENIFTCSKMYPAILYDECNSQGNEESDFIKHYCEFHVVKNLSDRMKLLDMFKSGKLAEFLNHCMISSKISFKVIGYSDNEDLLSYYPHRKFLDLAVTYVVEIVDRLAEMDFSICVTNEVAEMIGMDEQRLYEYAYRNSQQYLRPVIYEMRERADNNNYPDHSIYIISNNSFKNGASVMLYGNEAFRSLSQHLCDDLYVLPSSTQEVIAIAASCGVNEAILHDMVSDMNTNFIDDEIILSSSIYRYSRKNDEFSIVKTE